MSRLPRPLKGFGGNSRCGGPLSQPNKNVFHTTSVGKRVSLLRRYFVAEKLIEHVNSEICLGTMSNVESVKRWLGGAFLSVRMSQNAITRKSKVPLRPETQISDLNIQFQFGQLRKLGLIVNFAIVNG
jgi:hypothetical protein